jgi:hypothetical protein
MAPNDQRYEVMPFMDGLTLLRSPTRMSTPPSILGQFGTHYNTRAVVAMVGLGANLPADATYPNARVDAKGDALNGSHRYRLHFKSGELPPVKAGERFLLNARLYWPLDTALDGRWGLRSSSLLTDGSIPRRTSRVERAGAARPPPWAGLALERFRWR